MRDALFDTLTGWKDRAMRPRLSRDSALRLIALLAIVALAAGLRFANLEALGYANHYYTAAVDAMLRSWHNFFFAAAEPGGSVSVDKPPVGLWLQTISAYFFGVNGFAVVLPQIVAGLLSVVVVYHLVRRSFGTVPGLLAALALAVTPVVVATDRNNTIDSTLILTLLLAAWAFIKATESGKLCFLLLGALLVGIGFNIKMLEAYLPLPAFFALYFLGSAQRIWRKMGYLTLTAALLLVVSLSWAVAVDLTPAEQRPYVGSSGDNSEMSLIVGYNGMERLVGMGMRGGIFSNLFGGNQGGGNQPGGNRDGGQQGAPGANGNDGRQPPGQGTDGQVPFAGQPPNGQFPRAGDGDGFAGFGGFGGGFGGMSGTGRAGPLRLFTAPLSKEASWLLPFGLFALLLLAIRARPRWPIAPPHQAMVLWGGWLLTEAAFFSVAGFFHEYYLSVLGPPLAVLVGIGVAELWRIRERHSWLAIALLLIPVGATLALQITTAQAFVRSIWWLPVLAALCAIGAALLIAAALRPMRRAAVAGFACVILALLITPGIWSGLTTLNTSDNQSLPAAYSGRASGPANRGGLQINQALLDYLQQHTQGAGYLMAVPSSMQGADYVLASGRPVLYLGGFMGQDKVVTADDLARLAASGDLRFIYWDARGGGFGRQSDLSSWVSTYCTPVTGFSTATRNSGAPDGTGTGPDDNAAGNRSQAGFGGMQVTLYACPGVTP